MHGFGGSIAFTLAALATAAVIAPYGAVLSTVWIVAVLGVLEVSLSLDNAVVNAKVLKGMSRIWRERFLTWGILIAVFGMRIIFPLAIVAIAASINPWSALMLAIEEEHRYASIMHNAHPQIAAFGGAFLMLVFLDFFMDSEKDSHWIGWIERALGHVGKIGGISISFTMLALLAVSHFLPEHEAWAFMKAGLWGVVVYVAVGSLEVILETDDMTTSVAKQGLAGFLYLEVLDASFSFDGVIGAFALSRNIFIIALGLGIGAMFVRSLTVLLVEKGTLAEYRYLEHGAFWAIGSLAGIMLASVKYEIPEAVTGLVGAVLIGAALLSSIIINRRAVAAES